MNRIYSNHTKVRYHKTTDLAAHVMEKLQHSKISLAIPPINVLEELFEILFYASMKTEESDLIRVAVTLIDPQNPDPNPPKKITKDRWSCAKFQTPMPLEVKTLVKLSKAANPSASSLAVYYGEDGKLFIWGMIDQAMHYQKFLNYESDSGSEQPGLFQVYIDDIATLNVMFDYELLASLKQNVMVHRYLDVFTIGPISKMIRKHTRVIKHEIKDFLAQAHPDENVEDWEALIDGIWTQTLSRLLINIQNFHHGGAILLTDEEENLDVKYQLFYDRLSMSVLAYIKESISNFIAEDKIEKVLKEKSGHIGKGLYLEEMISYQAKADVSNEISGAISFIGSHSCVDGVVLLSANLESRGFGTVLKAKKMPRKIFVSSTATASSKTLIPTEPKHFGTRHRSMISYCWTYPGSLGIVISQDGDIRVFTKYDDRLVMWENIKTQQYLKSHNLKQHRS